MKQTDSLFISDMSLGGLAEEPVSPERVEKKLCELDAKIKELTSEIQELIRKRDFLAQSLAELKDRNVIPPITQLSAQVHPTDSTYAKAAFLLSLFSPRTDIYALRSRTKDGRTTYYPKCINLWKAGCYRLESGKEKKPCSECAQNVKAELTIQAIIDGNFRNKFDDGRNAVGIYPLKEGNITRFVAIDLDEEDWMSASRSILITARQLGIAMAIERSFSGNGAHLWIFFAHDIPSAKARRLATLLIDRTRERDLSVSMKSYDRLFPSQDALSQKGYGNLILLPLVASATARGCTLFLDDDLCPYPAKEQVSYLSSLPRHSLAEIDAFIASLEKNEFHSEQPAPEQINPSWNRWIPSLSSNDILKPVIMYLSTGVSFDKQALSARAQEALRRIATVSNPSYYKELRKKDGYCRALFSRIPLFEENERVIKIPRGLADNVRKYFDSNCIPYTIEDHRTSHSGLKILFSGKLRPYQDEAVNKTQDFCCGIIAAATGSGKTMMALAIIASKKERTLIIVNSRILLAQWRSAVAEFLIIDEAPVKKKGKKKAAVVGTLDGSKGDNLTGIIDIATIQSLSSRFDNGRKLETSYGLVIVDECHHIAAEKFRTVLKCFDAKYVYGLSATVKRADGLERIVFSECGNVIFTYDAARLAYTRGIVQYFIPRFLSTTVSDNRVSFTELLNEIADNDMRNAAIADDIRKAYADGRSILVITRRIEQNNSIGKHLASLCVPNFILKSTMKQREVAAILQKVCTPEHPVLIATDKLLGEGVDIPMLDTLVLASPFMQEGAIQQYAGRIARAADGKKDTLIYDYADYLIPQLSYMYLRRLSAYKKLGYVSLLDTKQPRIQMLYDNVSFVDTFLSDISKASANIIIAASYIVSSKISDQICSALKERADKKVSVKIIYSRHAASFPGFQNVFNQLHADLIFMEARENTVNYAIIDNLICWYGDFSILGQSARTVREENWHSIMRIVCKDASDCFCNGMV